MLCQFGIKSGAQKNIHVKPDSISHGCKSYERCRSYATVYLLRQFFGQISVEHNASDDCRYYRTAQDTEFCLVKQPYTSVD